MEYIPLTPENVEKLKEQLSPEKPDYIISLCEAIKEYEGWFPGSRSFRNNNPGNCKYSSVGYLPKYGVVRKDEKNFAIFQDYETGWLYLQNLIKGKIEKHPEWSLVTFFKEYAPAVDDNDPVRYASWVAQKLSVNPFSYQIKNFIT